MAGVVRFRGITVGITTAEFFDRLVEAELFSLAELEQIRGELEPEAFDEDSEPVVRRLVRQGRLTEYQVERLTNGDLRHLVFGDYHALEEIGRGGMAAVYKARQRDTGRIVAIKLQEGGEEQNETAVRFDREVQAAAKLSHPNIVAAYDSVHREGFNYLVMEYVAGPTLTQYVAKRGPLPLSQASNYIYQSAAGLEHAHSKRIVHRDIKPDNLLIDASGTLKILDMGLVRFDYAPRLGVHPNDVDRLTQMGTMLGTADYMSPEQSVDPREADYRSDIYSLGCTWYFLLTGKPPFHRDSTMATLMAHQTAPIPNLLEDRPDLSEEVQVVFETFVAKDPYDRFENLTQVQEALSPFLTDADRAMFRGEFAPTARSRGGSASAGPRSSPIRSPSGLGNKRFASGGWWILAMVSLGLIAGAVLALGLLEVPSEFQRSFKSLLQRITPDGSLLVWAGVYGGLVGALLGWVTGWLTGRLVLKRS